MFVDDVAVEPWIKATAHALVWVVPAAGIVFVIGMAKWLERRHALGK